LNGFTPANHSEIVEIERISTRWKTRVLNLPQASFIFIKIALKFGNKKRVRVSAISRIFDTGFGDWNAVI
jgi:hypothetical protein